MNSDVDTTPLEGEALRALVALYHDRVYRFGVTVCRDGADADDAVQQAFITLARRPDLHRSAGVLPWLLTVVRHACLAMLRTVGLGRVPLDSSSAALEVADAALTPEASLQRFRLVSEVHAAIERLEPEARQVLILRDLEGLSGEEAAGRLGLSLAAMKSRLHRARLAIREHLLAKGLGRDAL